MDLIVMLAVRFHFLGEFVNVGRNLQYVGERTAMSHVVQCRVKQSQYEFHHGGFFVGSRVNVSYLDEKGTVWFDNLDRGNFHIETMGCMVDQLGYENKKLLFWCPLGKALEQLEQGQEKELCGFCLVMNQMDKRVLQMRKMSSSPHKELQKMDE